MGKVITNLAFLTMISTPAIAMAKAAHSPELGVGIAGAVAAAGMLGRPYIANAAATTATAWFGQGFVQSEDVALRKLVADYEKASGNTIDLSIVPFVALRPKEVAAITSGVVPDLMEDQDFSFTR